MKLTVKIQQAINLAAKLHNGQVRKADIDLPYISHCFSVAWLAANYTKDEEVVIAALLHDTIEDTGYTVAALEKDFGARVAQLVKEVSEVDKKSEMETINWQERKEKYLANLQTAEEGALIISAADKIHNLQSLVASYKERGELVWQAFKAPANKKLWLYEEVLKILELRLKNKIVAHLRQSLKEAKKIVLK